MTSPAPTASGTPPPRVGVLGLGTMGSRLARRAGARADPGRPVLAHDIDPERLASLPPGVSAVDGPADLAAACDIVLAVLPDAGAQRAALLGDGSAPGIVDLLRPGALLIDHTGGDPDTSRAIAARARERGCGFAAAPMSGGPRDAEGGTVSVALSGAEADVRRAARVLHALGCVGAATVVGDDPGAAVAVKILTNALWFGQAVLVAEALGAAEAQGVSAGRFAELLRGGPADSAFVQDYLDRFLGGDDVLDFSLGAVVGQLRTAAELVRGAGLADGTIAAVHGIHWAALERHGEGGELTGARFVHESAHRYTGPSQAGQQVRDQDKRPRGASDAVKIG